MFSLSQVAFLRSRPCFVRESRRLRDASSISFPGGWKLKARSSSSTEQFPFAQKLSAAPGLWPAFWILGSGLWPNAGEIDILENVGESSWTNFAMHGPGYSGDTPLVYRASFSPKNDITSWHVYSVDWSADMCIFRIDGTEKYRVTRATATRYGPWAFDDAKYLVLNLAVGGSYPQAINGVRTPYAGLPQATVDLIKAGKVRLLVDWVRVTKAATSRP
jgi:hypothetical protein